MTGWGRGRCSRATAMPLNPGGYGFGRGLGLRHGFGASRGAGGWCGRAYGWYGPGAYWRFPASAADEADALKAEADYLKQSLASVHARLDELEKSDADQR